MLVQRAAPVAVLTPTKQILARLADAIVLLSGHVVPTGTLEYQWFACNAPDTE